MEEIITSKAGYGDAESAFGGGFIVEHIICAGHRDVAILLCAALDPRDLIALVRASATVYRFLVDDCHRVLIHMGTMRGVAYPIYHRTPWKWWAAVALVQKGQPFQMRVGGTILTIFNNSIDYSDCEQVASPHATVLRVMGGMHVNAPMHFPMHEFVHRSLNDGARLMRHCPPDLYVMARRYLYETLQNPPVASIQETISDDIKVLPVQIPANFKSFEKWKRDITSAFTTLAAKESQYRRDLFGIYQEHDLLYIRCKLEQ